MLLAATISLALLLPTAAGAGAAERAAETAGRGSAAGPLADPRAQPSDLLPNMRLHKLYGVTIRQTKAGRKRLRFGTRAFNIGAGPLEVRGRLPLDGRMTEMFQWISDGAEGRELPPPGGGMFWAGDGHAHWHIEQFINVELYRLDDPASNRLLRKIGFCLIDLVRSRNAPAHAPPERVYAYDACGKSGTAESIKMGISVGYADDYPPLIAHQWIDITTLPRGRYRLCAMVNPLNHWVEADRANNFFWHDITLNAARSTFRIRASGRTPCGSYAGS